MAQIPGFTFKIAKNITKEQIERGAAFDLLSFMAGILVGAVISMAFFSLVCLVLKRWNLLTRLITGYSQAASAEYTPANRQQ